MAGSTLSGILEEMTIDEVKELNPNVCVIPVGSTEPHGPALPYGSDTFRVRAVCYGGTRKSNSLGGRVLCLPALSISLNNNFRRFPYACRISVGAFMRTLKDIVEMCHSYGADRIVIVNGHGGNNDVIMAVLRDLAAKDSPFVCMLSASSTESDEVGKMWENPSDHGGESETSVHLHLNPHLVRKDRISAHPFGKPRVKALTDFNARFVRPWHLYVPASAGGDATRSSAEKGRLAVESAVEGLGRFLSELSAADYDETFPY